MTLVGMGTNPPPGGHGGLRMPWGFSHGLPWLLPAAVCLSCVQASFPLAPTLSPDTRVWGRNEYIRSGVYGSVGIHVYWVRKEITPKILDLGSATLGLPLGVTRSAFILQIQKAGILQTCWAATLHLVKRRGPYLLRPHCLTGHLPHLPGPEGTHSPLVLVLVPGRG